MSDSLRSDFDGIESQGYCEMCGTSAGQVKVYKVGNQHLCMSHAIQEDSERKDQDEKNVKDGDWWSDFVAKITGG